MKYQVFDIAKLLREVDQVQHIDWIIMTVFDFLIYMKVGDSISIPGGVQFEKIGEAEIMLPQYFLPKQWRDGDFQDVVRLLQEYKLLRS